MPRLLLKRCLHGLLVLWVVATLTFLLLRIAPGGPFDSERKLPPEVIANLEANAAAADISLSKDELVKIDGIFPLGAAAGGRHDYDRSKELNI